jgi:hypothetical protein
MTTPHEVKFRLEQKLLDLAGEGGPVPTITGAVRRLFVKQLGETAFLFILTAAATW